MSDLISRQPEKRTEERTETHGVCLDAIDRQAAINTLHDEIVRRRINEDSNDDGALDEFDTEAILRRLPSAQPEIIRCKDCKYWNDEFAKDKSTCWLPCMSITTHRKWYCGSAERRADG